MFVYLIFIVIEIKILFSGVDRLVRHLNKNKVPFAIATSSTKKSFELKTSQHKSLFSLFNHVVCGGCDPEVKNGKPAPDIFLTCASRFPDQPHPERVLIYCIFVSILIFIRVWDHFVLV